MKIRNKITKRWFVMAATAVLVVLAVVVMYARSRSQVTTKSSETFYPKASEGQSTRPTTTTQSVNPTPTISPTDAPKVSADHAIIITAPTQGSTVHDGSVISGTANVASGTVYYRLKGGKSGQLATGQVAIAANKTVPYSFKLGFTNQVSKSGDQGALEVFTLNADGTQGSIASVTVNIQD